MATTNSSDFFRRLTRGMAVEALEDHSDRQLVERALAGRDESAFQTIVQRHGPMVYRVCWRVLLHPQDAEDAFQATFLVLAQKLRTVRKRASLASWLHGVARRVALKAKMQTAGRRRHEHEVSRPATAPPDDVTWKELRSVLDAELGELPERWRLPLILCYLEGRTQDEAASQLAWSKSTLRRRLEEARDALGRRLNGRGVVWPAALSSVLLSECIASAEPGLVAATVEGAASVAAGKTVATAASVKVAALAEGVLKAMLVTKLKTGTAVAASLLVMIAGAGTLTYWSARGGAGAAEEALVGAKPTATAPPNRWEKLLVDKDLTAKQRAAYEQIAKLRTIKLDAGDWGSISIPSFVKDSKLPTDVLFAMGLDALPMLAEALDDETPTATVITLREGDFKQEKVWKVNEFAALLIVRIAERDFVIGEFPKELGIRDIAQRPKAAAEFRKLVVAWHGKFASKTLAQRKIADVTDSWFRNRFDAIIWLGWTKTKDGRAPIAARVDEFYADKNREYSSLTRAEMSHCSLALGQIGNKADLPPVRKICKDMSYWLETYGVKDSGMLEDLFRSYQGLALLGEKDEAIKELERLFAAHGGKFEASARKEYAERLKAAKSEEADAANKGAAKALQFHPSATATDLKIELTTAAKATRPHKAIYLAVKVTNRSSDEILTGIAREWDSAKPAKVPGTLLYASIVPAKETKAPVLEPAYQAGDGGPDSILDRVTLATGKSAEFLLRMDWPGAGFVPARQFADSGGTYKVQVLLVFQKTGRTPQKLQYVMSEPTTVEVPGLKPIGAKPEPWTGEPVINGDELTGGKKLSTFKRLPRAADATLLRINCWGYKPVPDLTAANFPTVLNSMKVVKADDPKHRRVSLSDWSYAQFVTFYLGGLALLTAPDGSVGRVTFDFPK